MMPTSLGTVVVILLFVAPGVAYHSFRSQELMRGRMKAPSILRDPLEVLATMIVASTLLTLSAVGLLLMFQWLLNWLEEVAGAWLDRQFGHISWPSTVLASPEAWLAEGPRYIAANWHLVAFDILWTFIVALLIVEQWGHDEDKRLYLPMLRCDNRSF